MPITKSAIKALRSSKRKAVVNRSLRSRMKTSLDAVKEQKSPSALSQAFSAIDRALKKHIIHRNKAARLKSAASKVV